MIVLRSPNNTYDNLYLSNFAYTNIQNPLGRVSGVSDVNIYGPQYSIRVWMNPLKMASLGLSAQDIITAISVVLICFVSISLVVSSIMIGIITYISVLERTKEIGILRAVGASKKDVSRVFNAETMIIGLLAGLVGIVVTVLLCFPISWIARSATNIQSLTAVLPWYGYLLVVLSVVLTLIAGIFPSRMAAKKDPVVALRTE
jgi:putative ABC transport system permease protein